MLKASGIPSPSVKSLICTIGFGRCSLLFRIFYLHLLVQSQSSSWYSRSKELHRYVLKQTLDCDIALTESDHILLKEHSMPGKSDKILSKSEIKKL